MREYLIVNRVGLLSDDVTASRLQRALLITDIEGDILAIDGVKWLYPDLTQGSGETRVRMSEGSPDARLGAVISVEIGTDGARAAPAVAHSVHDAVLSRCRLAGVSVATIQVRVARIG